MKTAAALDGIEQQMVAEFDISFRRKAMMDERLTYAEPNHFGEQVFRRIETERRTRH
jgi:hypothetical protein